MRKLVVAISIMTMCYAPMQAQPDWSLQAGFGGLSFSWLAVHVEATVVKFDSTTTFQSIRVASGYGIRMLNATYLPLQSHLILFHGSDHVEVIAGLNVQIAWQPDSGTFKEFSSSPINPTVALGYRYEHPRGGFVFRFGLGGMWHVADCVFLPCAASGIGVSF